MPDIPQQQSAGQSSILFRFNKPIYGDYAGLGRIVQAISNQFQSGGSQDSLLTGAAGLLGPTSKAPDIKRVSKAPIDIKQDFLWTSSKSDPARADMPYVYLTEKIVDRSSRLQNLMYNTISLAQSPLGTAAGAIGGAALAAKFAQQKAPYIPQSVAKVGGAVVGGVAAGGIAAAGEFLSGETFENNLRAYSGLYSTSATDFVYKLPFVKTTGSISKSITQNWSEASSLGSSLESMGSTFEELAGAADSGLMGVAGDALNLATKGAKSLEQANEIAQQGLQGIFAAAYTESAKSYAYGGNPSFDISFYLFNNVNWSETVKNWYAVFALQYQNLPNRLNRLILTPSVIYEATVPGYFYSMYTYIKSVDVSYIGSNLLIDIPILQSNSEDDVPNNISNNQAPDLYSNIKVIVPEVYKISLSFESLIPETQNLFYEAMVQTRSNTNFAQTFRE
jgi:hypothetical protein